MRYTARSAFVVILLITLSTSNVSILSIAEGERLRMLRESQSSQVSTSHARATPESLRGHVLVVEDDLIIADLIDQILRFEGFEVSHVGDGQSAVEFVSRYRPDLILMDLMLPVMGGAAASRVIKGIAGDDIAQIPIVAMSAGVNLRAAAGDLPVDGVLAKPFDIDELLATVNVHVRDSPSTS